MRLSDVGICGVKYVVFHKDNVVDQIIDIHVSDFRASREFSLVVGICQRHVVTFLAFEIRIAVSDLARCHNIDIWIKIPQLRTRYAHLIGDAQT